MTATRLASFPEGLRAAVFGASGGIGAAIVGLLADDPRVACVYAGARRPAAADHPRIAPFAFDLRDEDSIAAAADAMSAEGPLHLVILATGVLHGAGLAPEKSWRALTPEAMTQAFAINAIGPALVAKHMLGRLAKGEKAAFAALSARVGSIADNRLGGWHAYRASKAALNMMVRNFAIELARSNRTALAVALHPGTVDTALSQPFQSAVAEGKLFSPETSAAHLLCVVDGLGPEHSGRLFAWDGAELPF
jgi:NAD(P)-dependent dehydrogenase (short-subunit alcohol dehydrogenase family)